MPDLQPRSTNDGQLDSDEWEFRYRRCVQSRDHCMTQLDRHKQAVSDCLLHFDFAGRGAQTLAYATEQVKEILAAVEEGRPWIAPVDPDMGHVGGPR